MKCEKCQNKPYCFDGNHELTKHGCLENGECSFAPITNADRIRDMSDEELANFLARHVLNLDGVRRGIAHNAWLVWLKQEVWDD